MLSQMEENKENDKVNKVDDKICISVGHMSQNPWAVC
jgi:hypothetical protein